MPQIAHIGTTDDLCADSNKRTVTTTNRNNSDRQWSLDDTWSVVGLNFSGKFSLKAAPQDRDLVHR